MTRRPRSRPPTYGMGTRLARILFGLFGRPWGWSFSAIRDEIGISERTLLRYVAACRRGLVDAEGRPLLEVIRRGERRVLRLADSARAPESTSYQALSFYFALTVFRFLDGTIIKEGIDDLGLPRVRRDQPVRAGCSSCGATRSGGLRRYDPVWFIPVRLPRRAPCVCA